MGTASFRVLAPDEVHGAIRTEWQACAQDAGPFALPAFFDAWCRAFSADRRGFLVVGFAGSTPVMFLPCWHARSMPDHWQGLGSFRADYTEAVAAPGHNGMFAKLWSWLWREAPCRSAKIARIRTESSLANAVPQPAFARRGRALASVRSMLRSGRVRYLSAATVQEHPFADRAKIELLAARLDSKDSRRKLGALRKQGEVTYGTVTEPSTLRALLPRFFAMHVAAFDATGRQSQFRAESERIFYEALVDEGLAYMDVLRLDERPIALHVGFQRGTTIYWYKPTFDMELEKMSPGRILLAHLFARAAAQDITCVDLLKGTETYKDDWASAIRTTVTTTLVERSPAELISRIGARCG